MKRLFVVGCPRSGTTWTLMLLAQHPKVVASQHVGFFHSLRGLEQWWTEHDQQGRSGGFGKTGVVVPRSESRDAEGGEAAGSAPTILDGILSKDQFYGVCRSTAERLFDEILGRKPGAEVVVDKTPENLRVAPFILQLFPDAYFLHVIRDPRSVYSSLRSATQSWAKGQAFPANPIAGSRFIRKDLERGLEIGRLAKNYHEIRYEKLLESGPGELGRIFDWLGLPADRALCDKAVEAASMKNLRKLPGAPANFFRKGEAEAWRDELSEKDVRTLEYMLSDMMLKTGYQPTLIPPSFKPPKIALDENARKGIYHLTRAGKTLLRKLGYVVA